MTILLLLYFIMILLSIRGLSNHDNYLSKETTTIIKGIFTIMILFSHFTGYIETDSSNLYVRIISIFGQLMVTMFLFYSGYGIMYSIINKKNYMNSFMKNRFLKTFIRFNLAIVIYIIINYIMGIKYNLSTYLLSLIGWSSIGNSNWFVFVILSLYIITYFSYIISQKNLKAFICTVFILSIVLIGTLYYTKESWWYNIILCYPLGIIYYYNKDLIEKKFLRNNKWLTLIILTVIFIPMYLKNDNIIIYEIMACIFCLLIVNITYIIKFKSRILYFFGTYAFEIYILQRISYMIFQKIFNNTTIYFIISTIFTIIISILYKKIVDVFINKIYIKEK